MERCKSRSWRNKSEAGSTSTSKFGDETKEIGNATKLKTQEIAVVDEEDCGNPTMMTDEIISETSLRIEELKWRVNKAKAEMELCTWMMIQKKRKPKRATTNKSGGGMTVLEKLRDEKKNREEKERTKRIQQIRILKDKINNYRVRNRCMHTSNEGDHESRSQINVENNSLSSSSSSRCTNQWSEGGDANDRVFDSDINNITSGERTCQNNVVAGETIYKKCEIPVEVVPQNIDTGLNSSSLRGSSEKKREGTTLGNNKGPESPVSVITPCLDGFRLKEQMSNLDNGDLSLDDGEYPLFDSDSSYSSHLTDEEYDAEDETLASFNPIIKARDSFGSSFSSSSERDSFDDNNSASSSLFHNNSSFRKSDNSSSARSLTDNESSQQCLSNGSRHHRNFKKVLKNGLTFESTCSNTL